MNIQINEGDTTMKQPMRNILVKLGVVAGFCVLLASCGGDSPESLVKSARDYLAKGDSSAAVIQLRNALQKSSNNAEARYLLGTILVERRDSAGAVKELRMALQLGYPPEQTLPALARALIDDGDAKELVSEFGGTNLGSADAQAALKTTIGDALRSLGKPKEAEAAFNAALAAKADFAPALLGVATLRAADGNIQEAKKIVDNVLTQPNAPPEASLLKARLLIVENQREEALAVLQKTVEAKPNYLPAHYELVSLLIGKGNLDLASTQVGAIRKVSKQDVRAYYFDALIASQRGNLPAAREAIQQVLKVSPQHLPSLLLAGEVEFRAGQFNQAQDYLRRALNTSPGLPYAERLLAATYLRMGIPARAVEVLQPQLNRGSPGPHNISRRRQRWIRRTRLRGCDWARCGSPKATSRARFAISRPPQRWTRTFLRPTSRSLRTSFARNSSIRHWLRLLGSRRNRPTTRWYTTSRESST
ncbi:MAG: PEP-CTERM system TPR-repeat protein PrsT [Betaproteobacteria bacterium]|nr:MAG: PEP-CTERM system TPR-repeat protein PrsT [Betaproteobacteria bacterium]